MHEYRRFVQQQLDERGWKSADLVRKSGLSRQLIWGLLKDDRQFLGQMPDESTLAGLSRGFGIPVELFRTAAARSLVGYVDDGAALTIRLEDVSTDALLNEVRRRIDAHQSSASNTSASSGTSSEAGEVEEALDGAKRTPVTFGGPKRAAARQDRAKKTH